jgi:endonuclease/exonuclease/phosphatase family metal-dependent hydrolase
MSMRLVSYNILHGGEGRADPIAEVILARRPDVVALLEANDPAVLERLAMRLNMDHVQAMGTKHAAAVLSRWPIVETINHAALQTGQSPRPNPLPGGEGADGPQSFLEALVVDPEGTQWRLGVVHLHPQQDDKAEQRRERELAVVMQVFERHRKSNTPHLLCGDFNAVSPVQEIDPHRLRPKARAVCDRQGDLPRRAVQRLLNAGYVDTFHAVHGRSSADDVSFTTNEPCLRVDYVFAWGFPGDRIKDAWIEHDRLAKYASDHFPVGVEIG